MASGSRPSTWNLRRSSLIHAVGWANTLPRENEDDPEFTLSVEDHEHGAMKDSLLMLRNGRPRRRAPRSQASLAYSP